MKTSLLISGLILVGLAGFPVRGGERALIDTTKSPDARMYMVDLGDVKWTGGLWADRFEVCRATMIPHMWELFQNEKDSHIWANFLLAAGQGDGLDGRHHGPPFDDGDFFKWFESVAQVYAVTHDPAVDRLMDQIIAVVAKAQREDGYFHTPTVIAERRGDPKVTAFADRNHFETYNMGHLMTAACIHYRATGKTTLLDVARKAADYLYGFYQRASPELARNAICPSHYMGMVEIYRATGDPRYLELARQLIEIRNEVTEGTDQNQDRVPFRQMTKAVGHAVRANYLYAGVADVVAETGDQTLLTPLEAIDEDVADHKLYITGTTGALYDGASPDGSADYETIQLVHQAYGRDYQLPNLTAYNESCATVGFAMWNWRMLALTGDARYADLFEQSLYNGVLAAISLDGKGYFYVNPLRKLHRMTWPLRWSRMRQPNIQASFCCPPNVVRTIAEAQDYIYSLSKDTLWVNLYGASALDTAWIDGGRIKLRQETDYPWSSAVKFTIGEAPARPIALKLRIPGWSRAGQASLRVNGRPVDGTPKPGTYFELKRAWKPDDTVELDLRFDAVLVEASPLVEETLGQVAVKYGPLVYCLESNDLPAGVRLEDVALALDTPHERFTFQRQKIANAELVTLSVPALEIRRDQSASSQLYHEVDPTPPRPIQITLIPYYAWDNRGDTEMTVWLPAR
ncbi:MAG: glycoside hydrolase family 127 protein [Opitutaceae bacterium]|jgi:DUF1680 family protein